MAKKKTPPKKSPPKKQAPKKHPLDKLKKVATSIKKSTKTVTKKVGGKIVKVGKKVGKTIIKDYEWVALMPFKVVMLVSLKAKGVPVSKGASIKTISSLFYVNVIAKKKHPSLEHISVYEDVDNAESAAFGAASLVAKNSGVPGADVSVSIIHEIINYFKGVSKKRKNAKTQSKIDKLKEEIKEAESKGETELANKLKAEEKELEKQLDPLDKDEKKAQGEAPGTPDGPLSEQEKVEADETEKVSKAVDKATKDDKDDKDEPEHETERKRHGIFKFFGHNKSE